MTHLPTKQLTFDSGKALLAWVDGRRYTSIIDVQNVPQTAMNEDGEHIYTMKYIVTYVSIGALSNDVLRSTTSDLDKDRNSRTPSADS